MQDQDRVDVTDNTHLADRDADTITEDAPRASDRVPPRMGELTLQTLSFRYAQTRDEAARETLIMHHQKLVHYVASRFIGSGETLEDLVQVGNIGLINALDRFDPSKDVKFSTYAMPTIVGEIKRHFRDKTWQVKVPRWLQELSLNVRKAQQHLVVRLGRPPTVSEIAQEVGATEDRTLEALEICQVASTISLDTRLDANAGGDSATLMDIVGRWDGGLSDIDTYSDLRHALECLDPRERQVIELRFFEDLSQVKIARELNISQMHVSRLQQRALERLRYILADEAKRPSRLRRKAAAPRPEPPPLLN
ncbi:MAG: SigB/SigF/SigG family RNA polymerase sigma factor [Capsulimonas sp.]|jgi:RNA polymerase sigma-B factor|uniref:SigB/SigF/SigG family RNA polymerase sigma factor n=1 Tax=Capsulimonas sp. TaxID=2494211 RepID=UPI003266BA0A